MALLRQYFPLPTITSPCALNIGHIPHNHNTPSSSTLPFHLSSLSISFTSPFCPSAHLSLLLSPSILSPLLRHSTHYILPLIPFFLDRSFFPLYLDPWS